jgi:hypothetical protein
MTIYGLFYNFNTLEHHTNPMEAIFKPLKLAEYMVYYFSSPILGLVEQLFDNQLAKSISLAVSALACIAAIAGIVHVGLVGKRASNRLAHFACLLLLFTLGAGLMTALSRVDFGVNQSLSLRYAVIQVLFWNGLTLLFAGLFGHWTRVQAVSLATISLFVSTMVIPSQFEKAQWSRERAEVHWTAVLAIINGVDDRETLTANILPLPTLLNAVAKGLAVRGWSVFAWPQPWWIGRQSSGLFQTADAARCLGSFDAADDLGRIENGAYVNGWAWDVEAQAAPEWVVLLDVGGVVRSISRSGLVRDDVAQVLPDSAGSRLGWRGYVAASSPLAELSAHAVLADGVTICPLQRSADPARQ